MKLDHITAIVSDTSVAVTMARLFGAPTGSVELAGMAISTFRAGEVELHVNAPIGPGPVLDYLRKHGPGLHHIALQVDAIETELARLAPLGFRARGAPVETAPGLREVFLDVETTCGIWIQLVERREEVSVEGLEADGVGKLVASSHI